MISALPTASRRKITRCRLRTWHTINSPRQERLNPIQKLVRAGDMAPDCDGVAVLCEAALAATEVAPDAREELMRVDHHRPDPAPGLLASANARYVPTNVTIGRMTRREFMGGQVFGQISIDRTIAQCYH